MENKEYNVYGIKYFNKWDNLASVTIAAESVEEAESILERAIIDRGHIHATKDNLYPETTDIRVKISKKGIVFGYDEPSDSLLK